jgi:hypothetical protein
VATELARRLPGIRVDVAPPPAVEALPRMDVAVFVGFASTGPLHLPVAVESVAQYAAVFGPDAPLAWDEQRGERVWAHLGPAVRAFFANGGRRCWVLRVARTLPIERERGAGVDPNSVAVSNQFAVPGVLALPAGAGLQSAVSSTRCEGSWSDRLRVGGALASRGLALSGWAVSLLPGANRFAFHTRFALRTGDLLQLGRSEEVCAYAVVDSVAVLPDAAGPYQVEVHTVAAFERLLGLASPSAVAGTAGVAGFADAVAATWLGDDPSNPPGGDEPPSQLLQFDDPVPASLETGHWARFNDGADTSWLRIDRIERTPAFIGSPPAMSSALVHAAVSGPAWRELGAGLPAALSAITQARLLDLDLRVANVNAQGSEQAFRLAGVGLTPAHRTSFWALQRDADFYRQPDDQPPAAPAELPRFPLAPLAEPLPLAWLPLGVEVACSAMLSPLPQVASALERDGLASFDETLFLDPELAGDGAETLIAHADDIRLIRSNPRALLGLHAVLGIGAGGLFNEASLLAIPDAIHLGWQLRVDPPIAPSEPSPGDAPDHWGTHRGPCASQTPAPAEGPDFGAFLDCGTRALAAPVLIGPNAPVPPGPYRLSWSDSEPGATYSLIEAHAADFSDAREVYRGLATEHTVFADREGVYRYQVFAWVGDDRSAGSNPVTVRVRHDEWVQASVDTAAIDREDGWLAVQRAALRMALASGDLFVALAMPRHFRTPQALRYAARLRTVRQAPFIGDAGAFGFDEARALSHGALYFPWAQSSLREAGGPIERNGLRTPRVVPPDGVAMGVLAARASRRGAWIAAANEPMKDVVALAPPVRADDRQALQDAQINLLRDDPRGFLALSADTLALDTELRPINVRRLLILLRRLALRRGMTYVFEPHGAELRRAVQRSFNTLMTDLFRRGAFAGATPSQSFRVVTDDTVSTPRDTDAGRFIVELHVAPSLPMRFIAVRLAQSGERLSVVEEL